VLGSLLVSESAPQLIFPALDYEDFSLEKHRRIYLRAKEIYDRGDRINRILLVDALEKMGQLQSVDGFSYVSSLDEGLPREFSADGYVRLVKEKAILRRTIYVAQALIDRCFSGDESEEVLSQAESVLAKLSASRIQDATWSRPYDVITGYPGGVSAFFSPSRGGSGIPWPWLKLSEMTCGMQRGDLIIVAGRPSMGKTVMALQSAYWASLGGAESAVFSLEMSKESLTQRLIADLGRIDAEHLRSGNLGQDERRRAMEALQQLEAVNLHMDDTMTRTPSAVAAKLRKLMVDHPIRLAVIDHVGFMKSGGRHDNRHAELTEIMHELKAVGKDLGVTMMVLCQLNRTCEAEKRRPELADLRESGTVEEDADLVVFAHRPERYTCNFGKPELKGVAEFIVAKQRNGPIGRLKMVFQHKYQRFDDGGYIPEPDGD
jgi:replicative DNA helicase